VEGIQGRKTAILARANMPCVGLNLDGVINGHAGLWESGTTKLH
jgi:hypothetical protein